MSLIDRRADTALARVCYCFACVNISTERRDIGRSGRKRGRIASVGYHSFFQPMNPGANA